MPFGCSRRPCRTSSCGWTRPPRTRRPNPSRSTCWPRPAWRRISTRSSARCSLPATRRSTRPRTSAASRRPPTRIRSRRSPSCASGYGSASASSRPSRRRTWPEGRSGRCLHPGSAGSGSAGTTTWCNWRCRTSSSMRRWRTRSSATTASTSARWTTSARFRRRKAEAGQLVVVCRGERRVATGWSAGVQTEAARPLEEIEQTIAALLLALARHHAGVVEGAAQPLLAVALLQERLLTHRPAGCGLPSSSVRVPEDLVPVAELDHVHAAECAARVRLLGRGRRGTRAAASGATGVGRRVVGRRRGHLGRLAPLKALRRVVVHAPHAALPHFADHGECRRPDRPSGWCRRQARVGECERHERTARGDQPPRNRIPLWRPKRRGILQRLGSERRDVGTRRQRGRLDLRDGARNGNGPRPAPAGEEQRVHRALGCRFAHGSRRGEPDDAESPGERPELRRLRGGRGARTLDVVEGHAVHGVHLARDRGQHARPARAAELPPVVPHDGRVRPDQPRGQVLHRRIAHRGRRVEEDDAALARPLQRLRDPPPHARALERRARCDEADGACGGVGSRRGELEARAPAARAGEGADEQRQQKPSWPAMHFRPGEPMSGKNHAWCLVVVQTGSMGMRPSAGANASSLAWRSDKKMTVPGLLGGTACQGPAGMLVAAYFDSVRTRRLPPLGFGARLGLATSALVVLVCIVQSWIVAEPRPRQLHAPAALVPGERAGTVAVGVSLEALQALRRRTFTAATLFAALFTPIAVLGAVLLTRAITRPLTVLASAADAIARGDFHTTVEVRTRDEIGRLARSFNAMVESLTRSRAALEEKVAELERANRLKSEFLATVSHELRPPRNVIIGYVEMLADPTGGRLDEEQATMIAAIARYSRLQLDLITNVLDFARLSSGQISFQVERFALGPLLAEIEALHARRLQNPRLALTVTVDPDLPMFETDRVKLQEIVHNLVDNAVKFTEAGRITLVARAGSDSSRVVIEVGDTGPGIPAEDLDTIFDAFHQVGESSTRRTNGVGLGLSIVKQLANALGGTVSVTSRIGEGSTFRIDVPCCLRAPGAPTPEAVPAAVVALDKVTRNVT